MRLSVSSQPRGVRQRVQAVGSARECARERATRERSGSQSSSVYACGSYPLALINSEPRSPRGVPLLASSDQRKKTRVEGSRAMIHQPSMGGIRGQASDIKVEAEMILGIRERVVRRAHLRPSADRRAFSAPSNAGRHNHVLVRIPSPQRYKPEPLTPAPLDASACLLSDQLLRAAERPVAREGGPGPRPRQLPQRAGGHGLWPGRSHRGVASAD